MIKENKRKRQAERRNQICEIEFRYRNQIEKK